MAEVEQGAITQPASKTNDPLASDGAAVRFGNDHGNAGFAAICGLKLCLDGQPFIIHGATTYGQVDNASNEVSLAKQGGVNTLELVLFEKNFHDLASQTAEDTWSSVDNFIATAKANGLHVILNLSGYSQALQQAGIKPTTYDWSGYLNFVTNRTNTKTGIKYKDEPAIIMYELVGEIDAPNYSSPTRGTTQETTEFFQRTLAQLKALAPKHVISSGGFSYLNDPNSGIDWRAIMADSHNEVCDVEINSLPDRNISIPMVASYCQSLGKPWFLAAWSSCFGPKWGSDDVNNWPDGDPGMAAHATDMYKVERNQSPAAPGPSIAAIGSDFWNLAPSGKCDIGPTYPQTFNVVKSYAP